MKKIDPGVGAAGMIALAAVLACFITVAVPVIRSEPPAHSSDWLGFAGGVVGGVMTLIAAAIAWVAVQKQIVAQQRIAEEQIASQRIAILQDRLAFLDNEDLLSWRIISAANILGHIERIFMPAPHADPNECDAAFKKLNDYTEKLRAAAEAFDRTGIRRRAISSGLVERASVSVAASNLVSASIDQSKILLDLHQQSLKFPIGTIAKPRIALSVEISAVEDACKHYQATIMKDIQRMDTLLKNSARIVGL